MWWKRRSGEETIMKANRRKYKQNSNIKAGRRHSKCNRNEETLVRTCVKKREEKSTLNEEENHQPLKEKKERKLLREGEASIWKISSTLQRNVAKAWACLAPFVACGGVAEQLSVKIEMKRAAEETYEASAAKWLRKSKENEIQPGWEKKAAWRQSASI